MLVTLRSVGPEDGTFLYQLYCSTRAEELANLDWDQAQRASFLRMQFAAYRQHYQAQLPEADHYIVLLNSRAIGVMIVSRSEDQILLADIALLPEHRSKGIGTSLVIDLLAEAVRTGQTVRVHVLRNSRAIGFYQCLGFYQIDDTGSHLHFEWSDMSALYLVPRLTST